MITVEKLEKHFGKLQVLRGVNQHIKQGEKVVIIGPSGSGKTTFLRCLNLLEHPTGGRILFEGVDITDPKCDINKIRRKMGMVFQQFNLFPHLNILKNITLAPVQLKIMGQEEAEANAMRLLKRVGLEDNLYLSRGVKATNVQLVERAIELAKIAGREIATAEEARNILGISRHALAEYRI